MGTPYYRHAGLPNQRTVDFCDIPKLDISLGLDESGFLHIDWMGMYNGFSYDLSHLQKDLAVCWSHGVYLLNTCGFCGHRSNYSFARASCEGSYLHEGFFVGCT